jgi:voltage-gated potassium channel
MQHPIGTKWHIRLRFLNDVLLIPLFTGMVIQLITRDNKAEYMVEMGNVAFCVSFAIEWALGLYIASNRRAYLTSPMNLANLVSAVPFGTLFQAVRALRGFRVFRMFRMLWRAKRYAGRGSELAKVLLVALATVLSGAYALAAVEGDSLGSGVDALWWSVVTVTTVGYGDVVPQSDVGRLVAAMLMVFGVGVFSYISGFMATLLEDPEEEELLLVTRRMEAKLDALTKEVAEMREAGR